MRVCPIVLLAILACLAQEARRVRAAPSAARAPAHDESLNGTWLYHIGDISPPATTPLEGWRAMSVPSNWFTQGLDRPGVVWFARPIDLKQSGLRRAIEFEGVDYTCSVYVDGIPVGEHRGYFGRFRVPLPRGLVGRHLLAVRVDSPLETRDAWSLRKTLIKGVLGHHDTRPGNAWSERGQDGNTGGIWGDVRLRSVEHAFFDDVRVTTTALSHDEARLSISAVLDAPVGSAAVRYLIRGPNARIVRRGTCIRVGDKISASIVLERPQPWWPRELGKPSMYSLSLSLGDDSSEQDRTTIAFGIRTVRRTRTGEFEINGTRLFLRGTNHIPGQYLASLTREALGRDLDMMAGANINAIRIHAHVTAPAFYDLADERGFLVWQDAPLQWGYDDSEGFAREAADQVAEMLSRLYNHPSIVLWSGLNEAPFSSEWMHWKYPDYDPAQNRLLERHVRRALVQGDPSRPIQSNAHPSEHAWYGWYTGTYRDFARPTPHAVITEFGAQALPAVRTLRTFLASSELWPLEGANLATWEYHGFQLKELRDIAKVPLGANVEELVRNTQAYQARLTQFAVENLRRQKWQPVVAIFQFMFAEHWPSMNWGVVDHLRHPKLGYSTLARAYQSLLPMAFSSPRGLTMSVVNDGTEPRVGYTLVVRRIPEGDPPRIVVLDVPANDVVDLSETLSPPRAGETLILELVSPDGEITSRNAYEPGYFQS